MIVCIPSKGRPNSKTDILYQKAGYKVYYFVEPQDFEYYNKENKINIGQNDKGIGFVRQFIIDWCKINNHKWILMSDDDIDSFGYVENNKCIKTDAGIFTDILNKAKKLPFVLYGMSFRQFAWSEKNKYSINTKVFTAVTLINIDKVKWKYIDYFKEDIAFLFDSIRYSDGGMKFNHYWFNTPAVGTNVGGCYDGYKNKKDIESFNYILNEYKGFTSIIKKKNRLDIKWDVKSYATKYKRNIL
jgi:hypothetical protein